MSSTPQGPVGLRPITFELADFTDPGRFAVFQEWVDQVATNINTVFGLHGDIPMFASIDMKGLGTVKNLAAPVNAGDAVSHGVAQASFGADAIQPQIEATGTAILQTTRRLNDQNQRELHSSFLNDVLNLPPVTNGSTVSVVLSGGNSIVTVTANNFSWGDGSLVPYAQRQDTFTNPGVQNFYYYYFRKSDNTLQFIGPFTADTPQNAFAANIDGRGFVAKATVNAGGGGAGGGGGTGGGGLGGCTEIGTPLEFPDGCMVEVAIEPCGIWHEVMYEGGEKVSFAAGTLLGMFMRVNDKRLWAAKKDGGLGKIESIRCVERESFKQVVKVKPQGTYWVGRGKWFVHNFKVAG